MGEGARGCAVKGAVHTCQDQEVLNTLSHGVLKEPQILPDSVGCALEPLLLEGALAGCKHLLTATQDVQIHIYCGRSLLLHAVAAHSGKARLKISCRYRLPHVLPLVGLARSKRDRINHGHGAHCFMLTTPDINDKDSPVAMLGASRAASCFVFSTEGGRMHGYTSTKPLLL